MFLTDNFWDRTDGRSIKISSLFFKILNLNFDVNFPDTDWPRRMIQTGHCHSDGQEDPGPSDARGDAVWPSSDLVQIGTGPWLICQSPRRPPCKWAAEAARQDSSPFSRKSRGWVGHIMFFGWNDKQSWSSKKKQITENLFGVKIYQSSNCFKKCTEVRIF